MTRWLGPSSRTPGLDSPSSERPPLLPMKERRTPRKVTSLAGQLLLAHPVLQDAHFKRTVVLLSSHDADGAMGVVLNRPLSRQLGEVNAEFALGPLAGVPLYYGGPVEPDQ